MELTIQATLKNPLWQGRITRSEENLTETWIETKRENIRRLIDGIVVNQRDARISRLATVIFSTPDVTCLSYMTALRMIQYFIFLFGCKFR